MATVLTQSKNNYATIMQMDARKIGPAFPIDDGWKRSVRAEMDLREWSLTDLADKVGARPPSVHYMLSSKAKASALVPRIHDLFGWPAPTIPTITKDTTEIVSILDRLDDDGIEWLTKQAEMYLGLQQKAKKP
jgi:hypothetical protein